MSCGFVRHTTDFLLLLIFKKEQIRAFEETSFLARLLFCLLAHIAAVTPVAENRAAATKVYAYLQTKQRKSASSFLQKQKQL